MRLPGCRWLERKFCAGSHPAEYPESPTLSSSSRQSPRHPVAHRVALQPPVAAVATATAGVVARVVAGAASLATVLAVVQLRRLGVPSPPRVEHHRLQRATTGQLRPRG